jgi:hypothetical protein
MKHRMPVFDGDGHVLETDAGIEKYFEGDWNGSKRMGGMTIFPSLDGWARSVQMHENDRGRRYWYTNAEVWADMLDRIGLEGSVLYPTIGLAFGLMRDIDFSIAAAAAYNNWIEGEYTAKDGRLYGVGLMQMEQPGAAIAEMRRCRAARTNIVAMLLPSVTAVKKSYGHASYWPIYEEAEKLGMPLAVHGAPSQNLGLDHLDPFVKVHTLAHPLPIFVHLTDMMFSGVFDDFPKLKVAYLETGASWLPFMMDRLDIEWDSIQGAAIRKKVKHKPSYYFTETDNIWVSCEMGERALKYVIDMAGPDRILYASDFPHEPTEEDLTGDVPEFLEREEFDDDVKAKILYRNAKRLYGIA